jgi:hypothetical protein
MEHDMPKTLPNKQAAPAQSVVAKPHANVTQAQSAFDKCIARFTSSQLDVGKARDALSEANEGERGVRVTLLIELAKASTTGDWSIDHAKMGVEAAIEAFAKTANDTRTVATLKQFASECYRAIHPQAREHVEATFTEADELWDAEGERIDTARDEAKASGTKFQRDSVDTPLRDAFKRKYHMVVGSNGMLAARAAKDEDRQALAEVPEMLAQAVMSDERADQKRAARMIARAVSVIEEISDEFPSDRWDVAIKFLKGIDADKLVAFRNAKRRTERVTDRERPQRSARREPSQDEVNDAAGELIE